MLLERLLNRFSLIMLLALVVIGLSACYKDAGDDMEPTSNRVDLNDIAPTTSAPPEVTSTPTAAEASVETPTRTLVPTTTPIDFTPDAESTVSSLVELEPTPTSLFAPSFTPAITIAPAEPGIATPGMSDIQASPTNRPTVNPAFQPTPTSLPVEENPCVHIVKPNDTLYSISQNSSVLLNDLVAANPSLLGGNPNTPLQIGWQLQIPGCQVPGTEPTAGPGEIAPPAAGPDGFPKTHVVQAGETLFAIARQYGVSPEAIIAANNLVNPNLLQPGDTLTIPAP